MGWCRGSYIAEDIFKKVSKYLPQEVKKEFAEELYEVFCNEDADCWDDEMEIIQAKDSNNG